MLFGDDSDLNSLELCLVITVYFFFASFALTSLVSALSSSAFTPRFSCHVGKVGNMYYEMNLELRILFHD